MRSGHDEKQDINIVDDDYIVSQSLGVRRTKRKKKLTLSMFIVMFEPWHSWMCVDDLEREKEEKSRRRKTLKKIRSCEDQLWAAGRRTSTSRTRNHEHLCVVVVVQKSHESGR